jgi:hypothetical protein
MLFYAPRRKRTPDGDDCQGLSRNYPAAALRRTLCSVRDQVRKLRAPFPNAKVTVKHCPCPRGGQAIVVNVKGVGCAPNRRITPCNYTCTGRNVADHERRAGRRAGRQRWQTVDAECTVVPHRVHRRATGMRTSTDATLRRLSPDAARFLH